MYKRLENTGGGSNKFWQVTVKGASYTIQYGAMDSPRKPETKSFASEAEALAEADKVIKKKLKDGYVDVTDGFEQKPANAAPTSPPVGAGATPTGSVRASSVITQRNATTAPAAQLTSPLAQAALDAITSKKAIATADVGKLLEAYGDNKVGVDDMKAVLTAYASLFSRADFLSKAVPKDPYDKQQPSVATLIDAAACAIELGVLAADPQGALFTAMGQRGTQAGAYHYVYALAQALERSDKDAASKPAALALLDATLDALIAKGKDPASFLTLGVKSEKLSYSWTEHVVERLAKAHDPASLEGAATAQMLVRAGWYNWVRPDAAAEFLNSKPSVRHAVDAIEKLTHDAKHVVAKHDQSFAGFAVVGDVVRAVGGNGIVTKTATATTKLAATEQYAPKSLVDAGGQLLALTENTKQNNVAHLQLYTADGARLGSNVLPRPVHHLVGSSSALAPDGSILYASSDSGSQDMLAKVSFAAKDGKLTLSEKHVAADATEGEDKKTGFKLRAVAVEGKRAFGALHHEGNNQLRLIAYELPSLGDPKALATVPYVGSHNDGNQVVVSATHIFVGGDCSLMVFERDGDQAKLLGTLPIAVDDMRLNKDGGLDLAVNNLSFKAPKTKVADDVDPKSWQLLRLSAKETKDLIVGAF